MEEMGAGKGRGGVGSVDTLENDKNLLTNDKSRRYGVPVHQPAEGAVHDTRFDVILEAHPAPHRRRGAYRDDRVPATRGEGDRPGSRQYLYGSVHSLRVCGICSVLLRAPTSLQTAGVC